MKPELSRKLDEELRDNLKKEHRNNPVEPMNTKAIIQKLCEVIMHVGAFDPEEYNIKSVIHELEATNSCNECDKLAKELSLLQEQKEERVTDEMLEREFERTHPAKDEYEKMIAVNLAKAVRDGKIPKK